MAERNHNQHQRELAETLALRALTFILSEPSYLQRFLAETGLTPDDLRAAAQSPELLGAVLQYLLGNEAMLLAFAANEGVPPEDIARADLNLAAERGLRPPITSV